MLLDNNNKNFHKNKLKEEVEQLKEEEIKIVLQQILKTGDQKLVYIDLMIDIEIQYKQLMNQLIQEKRIKINKIEKGENFMMISKDKVRPK